MTHKPPEHLTPAAAEKWAELLPILEARGPLDAPTLDALSCYVSAWARLAEAEAQIKALGAVVRSPAGFAVQNPYLNVAAAAQRQLRQWGDVLGLIGKPARRPKKAAEPDPLAAFLSEKQT